MASRTPRAEEAFSERTEKLSANGSALEVEIPYVVFDSKDEDEALTATRTRAGTQTEVDGMRLESVEIVERLNETTWKTKAVYVDENYVDPDDADPNDNWTFAFDTGGGTKHVNQSLKTVSRTPKDAPDFNGAIEVDNAGNINGVDVTMPVLNFTETHTLAGSRVTADYKKKVASLTGTVNKSAFRGFAAGEVLFLGAAGTRRSKRASATWEITYRFAVSQNATNLKVGNLVVSSKKGWEYLWGKYAQKVPEGGRCVVPEPTAVYVEQVYAEGDFSQLGIGTDA